MALFFPPLSRLSLDRYGTLVGPERMREAASRIAAFRARLAGRVVWNVSSSYVGGGVAEMVRSLLAYARGAEVDARWAIVRGSPEFFRITKRLHNALHGSAGDGSPLGENERRVFEATGAECAAELAARVGPRDIVIVHDPQPAGMIAELARRGARVIWRCHIGSDHASEESDRGWRFLAPSLERATAFVFSRAAYLPSQLDASRAVIVPPSIDPFSAKNQPLSETVVRAILVRSGILSGPADGATPAFLREDGTPGRVARAAEVLRQGGPPSFETPLVVQVSRWDRLKDPVGVLRGFAAHEGRFVRKSILMLAGPSTSTVADDPEDARTYREVVDAWRELPEERRARVQLLSLPVVDVEENAAIVNALQRHASVIVQKSLHEGFGLTVTEAMWKGRPVVASAVGGIQDQIDSQGQGLLLRDPTDLRSLGDALDRLLGDPELSRELGRNAQARVLERYLGIDSLLRFGTLIEKLDAAQTGFESEAA